VKGDTGFPACGCQWHRPSSLWVPVAQAGKPVSQSRRGALPGWQRSPPSGAGAWGKTGESGIRKGACRGRGRSNLRAGSAPLKSTGLVQQGFNKGSTRVQQGFNKGRLPAKSLLKYSGGGRKSAVSADTANRRPACRVAPEHGLQARGPHALTGRRPVFHRRAWVFQQAPKAASNLRGWAHWCGYSKPRPRMSCLTAAVKRSNLGLGSATLVPDLLGLESYG